MGQIMVQGLFNDSAELNKVRISTSLWPGGLYTVQLLGGNQPLAQPRQIMVRH
jgi:hypothetical protein